MNTAGGWLDQALGAGSWAYMVMAIESGDLRIGNVESPY